MTETHTSIQCTFEIIHVGELLRVDLVVREDDREVVDKELHPWDERRLRALDKTVWAGGVELEWDGGVGWLRGELR